MILDGFFFTLRLFYYDSMFQFRFQFNYVLNSNCFIVLYLTNMDLVIPHTSYLYFLLLTSRFPLLTPYSLLLTSYFLLLTSFIPIKSKLFQLYINFNSYIDTIPITHYAYISNEFFVLNRCSDPIEFMTLIL